MAAESVHRRPHFSYRHLPTPKATSTPRPQPRSRLSSRALVTFSTAESATAACSPAPDLGVTSPSFPTPTSSSPPTSNPSRTPSPGSPPSSDSSPHAPPRDLRDLHHPPHVGADAASDRNVPRFSSGCSPPPPSPPTTTTSTGTRALINTHSKDPRFPIKLPACTPMEMRDLPSFITTADAGPTAALLLYDLPRLQGGFRKDRQGGAQAGQDSGEHVGRARADAFESVPGLDLIPIGPVLPARPSSTCSSPTRRSTRGVGREAGESVAYVSS
ncbi:uncharacterized protein A4U43_C06F11600 [Asparagus officinalis]|uniref:Uncharacterized protein n=1 Tax=Asparagus officinalis TaxID=4686 RepID=A0A5P1ELU4_ASPOF|nr:uncharacterized protein A4U43_C06F11600 [Asparagus officinalis]